MKLGPTRILVTGGAGNIGGSLVRRLVQRPHTQVMVVDNLQTGSLDKLPDSSNNLRVVRADVNEYGDVAPAFFSFQPDFVFHFAATVGVARTISNPMMVLKDVDGLRNILTLCKGLGVKRIFYASSSEVYGEPVEFPQRENSTPLNSKLPYAVVKNLGEIYCKTFYKEYRLPYTIFRFFNTYGPLQSDDFVISRFINQAIAGRDITIYGDGSQSRTFCYVDDNVDFQLSVLDQGSHENDIINVGSDREVSILELAHIVRERVNPNACIVHKPALPEGDMRRRVPDIEKMRAALQRSLVTLEAGIDQTAHFIASKSREIGR